jgi:hypothetical protein
MARHRQGFGQIAVKRDPVRPMLQFEGEDQSSSMSVQLRVTRRSVTCLVRSAGDTLRTKGARGGRRINSPRRAPDRRDALPPQIHAGVLPFAPNPASRTGHQIIRGFRGARSRFVGLADHVRIRAGGTLATPTSRAATAISQGRAGSKKCAEAKTDGPQARREHRIDG